MTLKVLFVHRSVGQQLVDEIRSDGCDMDIELWDYNANTNCMTNGLGVVSAVSEICLQGGDTNPPNLARFMSGVSRDTEVRAFLGGFDLVAFKSCYSACAIKSESQLTEYAGAIGSVVDEWLALGFRGELMLVTPPPRRPLMTSRREIERAERFVQGIIGRTDPDKGVHVLDLFSVLSSSGTLKRSFRRRLPIDQHPNAVGAKTGADAFAAKLRVLYA